MSRRVLRLSALVACLLCAIGAHAQTAAISNHCYLGGTQAKTSGLSSTNFQLGIVPSCTVTVYLTGTQTKATIFRDGSGTALSNPFTGNTVGSVDLGGWVFFSAINQGYDIVMSGGIAPNTYPSPVTLTDVFAGSQFSGGGGTVNPNQFAVGNNTGVIVGLPEMGTSTTGGVTTVAWEEDQSQGLFDVRRPRTPDPNGSGTVTSWTANREQAFLNTINAAACWNASTGVYPVVKLPAGSFSGIHGIVLPPNLSLQGQQGNQASASAHGGWGGSTLLIQGDATARIISTSASFNALCNGTSTPISGKGADIAHIMLQGLGGGANTDEGLFLNAPGSWIHDVAYRNFGGRGIVSGSCQNSRGDHIYLDSNLQWYMFSGLYNPTSFADTNFHGSAELICQDGHWDHVEEYGYLPDLTGGGWFNRWYLTGVLLGGGPGAWLHDSFIQINPHDVVTLPLSSGAYDISGNRLDGAWYETVMTPAGGQGTIEHNSFVGYCISLNLNPANFGTNPVPGTSPDPNCAAYTNTGSGQGAKVVHNNITEFPAVWASWPTFEVFSDVNTINNVATLIDQPGALVGGYIGGDQANTNVGADVDKSVTNVTLYVATGSGSTAQIDWKHNRGVHLISGAATTWTTWTNVYPDTTVYLYLSANDTVNPGSTLKTCDGNPISGTTSLNTFVEFHLYGNGGALTQIGCPTYKSTALIDGTLIIRSTSETVTFSATPTFSAGTLVSRIVLTGTVTTFTLPAGLDGQPKTLTFVQDGTGGHPVTPPSNVLGFTPVGTTANKRNSQSFKYSVADAAWLADSPGVINE